MLYGNELQLHVHSSAARCICIRLLSSLAVWRWWCNWCWNTWSTTSGIACRVSVGSPGASALASRVAPAGAAKTSWAAGTVFSSTCSVFIVVWNTSARAMPPTMFPFLPLTVTHKALTFQFLDFLPTGVCEIWSPVRLDRLHISRFCIVLLYSVVYVRRCVSETLPGKSDWFSVLYKVCEIFDDDDDDDETGRYFSVQSYTTRRCSA